MNENEFGLSLARLEAKLDVIFVKLEQVTGTMLDHEVRIRALEKRIWQASGAAAVVGSFAGILFAALGK